MRIVPSSHLLLALILPAVLLGTGCGRQAAATPGGGGGAGRPGGPGGGAGQSQAVEVTPLRRLALTESLNVVGSFAANESADIRAEISGLVRAIHFEEGQPVKKGDLLVKIDDAELVAQLAQAEATFNLAQLNLRRSENLGETRTIPQSELDRARSDFANARAALTVLKTRIEKTSIVAPFDGVVGSRTISPGDFVNTATSITTLNDLSRLKVEFQVPERFLHKVEPGTHFVVHSRAMERNKEVRGEVYFVSAVIDRSTRSSEVKGLLTDPPPGLKPGMFANIELVLEVRQNALTVPEGAILTTPAGTQIVAVGEKEGRPVAEFIPVRLGLRARGLVEVAPLRGELNENQSIVASGVGALILYPGAILDPRPLRAEFRLGEQ
jgi:membrane fusion protein, multidrug efflux system